MTASRRQFLLLATAARAAVTCTAVVTRAWVPQWPAGKSVTKADLDRVHDQPVLVTDFLKAPVTVASIELLRNGKVFLLRTRSTDGAEAITVPNSTRLVNVYPFLLNQVIPVVLNKDARTLEALLWEIYRHNDNYKYQGMALWIANAAVEMALLELMGQTAQRPLADFFGGA